MIFLDIVAMSTTIIPTRYETNKWIKVPSVGKREPKGYTGQLISSAIFDEIVPVEGNHLKTFQAPGLQIQKFQKLFTLPNRPLGVQNCNLSKAKYTLS